jgi:RND family efflux transporter MFP subunit
MRNDSCIRYRPARPGRAWIRWTTAALCLLGCADEPVPPEILRPVRSQIVTASGGTRTRSFSGTAKAGQEIELSFRVSGKIERLPVRVGERVAAGQLIAQLEQEDFRIDVQQARASLAQAEASARNADSNLDRIRELWENNNASQNELDSARAAQESARARVAAAQESLKSDERQLGYARLVSPVEGAIASVPVNVNENVSQGQTVVLLTSGSRSEVEVGMPEVLIAQVREGESVTVSFDALPGDLFDAVVTEVGVAATGTATTFPVTVRLVAESSAIRSGMAAEVAFRFQSSGGARALLLPPVAVGEDREGRYVFVVEPPDDDGVAVVRRRSVVVDEELTPDGIRLLSGIAEGDRVVTAGVRRLTDGQRVRFEE